MIFTKAQKESLASRISFMESELEGLREVRNIAWDEYRNNKPQRRNVERLVENLVNALIDLSKIVLSDKSSGEIPATYIDVILKLGELKLIDMSLAEKLAQHIKLRNFLAHQYLDLRWDRIKSFIQNAPEQLQEFINQIKKFI